MSLYFAKIEEDNLVSNVVISNSIEWCKNNIGGSWIETKQDGSIRKNYAGIGYTYDEERDAFIPPKPFTKWILNEDTCQWEAPVPYPQDGKFYVWNDNKGEWEEVV